MCYFVSSKPANINISKRKEQKRSNKTNYNTPYNDGHMDRIQSRVSRDSLIAIGHDVIEHGYVQSCWIHSIIVISRYPETIDPRENLDITLLFLSRPFLMNQLIALGPDASSAISRVTVANLTEIARQLPNGSAKFELALAVVQKEE